MSRQSTLYLWASAERVAHIREQLQGYDLHGRATSLDLNQIIAMPEAVRGVRTSVNNYRCEFAYRYLHQPDDRAYFDHHAPQENIDAYIQEHIADGTIDYDRGAQIWACNEAYGCYHEAGWIATYWGGSNDVVVSNQTMHSITFEHSGGTLEPAILQLATQYPDVRFDLYIEEEADNRVTCDYYSFQDGVQRNHYTYKQNATRTNKYIKAGETFARKHITPKRK